MDEHAFEGLLRRWGWAYGQQYRPGELVEELPEHVRAPDVHPLAVGMRHAPGSRSSAIRQRTTMHRDGYSRRATMAAAVGLKGVRVVPMAYCDPVPCIESRRAVYGSGELARPVPAELAAVERHALDLHAIDTLRGLVLRVNYCTRLEDHAEKAAEVQRRFGSPVVLKRYRDELKIARVWMHARLTAHPLTVT